MAVKCEITLPEGVLKALGVRDSEDGFLFRKELAVYFFQRSMLSFGQARQLSDLSVWDFIDLLRDRKVPLHYGVSEYEEDIRTIQEII